MPNVDDDHVGLHQVDEIEQLLPVAGLRNHVDLLGVLEDQAESPADHRWSSASTTRTETCHDQSLHGYIVGRSGGDLYLR